ncbi:MAG: Rod shape-determining protein MreD [Bernardetiaceae bacterium]
MAAFSILFQVFAFLGYAAFQVFFLEGVVLGGVAFCWLYVSFLLFLPLDTDSVLLLLIAFTFGLLVDAFYDSSGVHTAATLVLAYARKWVLDALRPSNGYENGQRPLLGDMSWRWFSSYVLVLLLVHHTTLFLVESVQVFDMGLFLLKVLSSTVFTFVSIVLFQYLFYRKYAWN